MRARKGQKTQKALWAECAAFNNLCPVGRAVIVRRDDGTESQSKTRSEAWVMGGHSAVVLVDGIAGGYSIERVTPCHAGQPQN